MTDEELIAALREWQPYADEDVYMLEAADRIEALVDEVERLTKERDSAVRGQDDWRNDYKALSSAIVGDSGLSAMLVATQARLFKPRAEAAEAKVEKLEAAVIAAAKIGQIVGFLGSDEDRIEAFREACGPELWAKARAALAEIEGEK